MMLADRLRQALTPPRDGDPRLLTSDHRELDERAADTLVPAAVLVAVTDRARPGVILTQRHEALRRHAGQIAFPGGRVDPGEDAVAAALREAEEEVALPRATPVVIGTLDPYRTVTSYTVTPVLAAIPADLPLAPAAGEVESVFEVPLDFLLDPANQQARTIEWRGRERHVYELHWDDRRIWGATAAMIVNLSRRLAWR